ALKSHCMASLMLKSICPRTQLATKSTKDAKKNRWRDGVALFVSFRVFCGHLLLAELLEAMPRALQEVTAGFGVGEPGGLVRELGDAFLEAGEGGQAPLAVYL